MSLLNWEEGRLAGWEDWGGRGRVEFTEPLLQRGHCWNTFQRQARRLEIQGAADAEAVRQNLFSRKPQWFLR